MFSRKTVGLFVVLVLCATGAFAQATASHTVSITVSNIGVIALNDTTNINFATTAPAAPGDPVGPLPASPATNTTKGLFYTCANNAGMTRHITVGSDIAVPAGTTLQVDAAVAGGAGTNAGPKSITTTATDLVTAIGSVATGTAFPANGAALTYSFWVSAPGSLVVGGPTVVNVTYTMTADTF